MEIYINTVYGQHKFEILNHWKVKDLKVAASNSYGISEDEQIMYLNGEELKNNDLFSSLAIESGSLIDLIFNFNEFRVTVIYETENIDFDVKKNEKVLDLKRKICNRFRKSIEEIFLICKGAEMADDKVLGDFEINEKSVINVIPRLVEEQRQLLVRLDNGKSVEIDYGTSIKGAEVKEKLKEKLGDELECIGISLNGQSIADNEYVGDDKANCAFMSINADCLPNQHRFDIQLIVKQADGRSISVKISKKAKCIVLKEKLIVLSGIALNEQSMSFKGVTLDDDKLLEEYQIGNNSIIELTMKLRGGKNCSYLIYKIIG